MKIQRVIQLIVLLTLVAALGLAVRKHSTDEKAAAQAHASILQRRIPSIQLDGVPASTAFANIQELSGVPIEPNWNAMGRHYHAQDEQVWLQLQDATVEQAMEALTEQLRGYEASAGFEVLGGRIIVAPDNDLPVGVRIYDMADLLQESSSKPPMKEISEAFCCYLEPRYSQCGYIIRAQEGWLHENAGHFMIEQTFVRHGQIAEFLQALRQARPDGTGPALSRTHVFHKNKEYTTVIRFYDVRDLAGRCECTIPAVLSNDGSIQREAEHLHGAAALARMLTQAPAYRKWKYTDNIGTVYPVCGRIVVEQTPENQQEVQTFLREFRSGAKKVGPVL